MTPGDCEIFPFFKLWVLVLFADSLRYVQNSSVCLGHFQTTYFLCFLALSVVFSVRFAYENETVWGKQKILYLLITMIKFVNFGRLSLSQKLYLKDYVSEKLQIISGVSEQNILG